MKKMILGGMLTAMAMSAAPARADANTDDVHCLVIFMQMSNAQAQAAQTGGLIGSFYYMGKLDARAQGQDLEKLIISEVSQMSEASFKADAKRCGDDMTRRGQAAADLGKALAQHAAQTEKPGQNPDTKPDPAKPDAAPAEKPQ